MNTNKLKKQIVFSDYDGTIYITEKNMKRNIESIEEYRELGGKFVIVTGRSKTSINNIINQYNLPFDYIISNNGAVILNSNMEEIYEQTISEDISSKIIKYLNQKQNEIEIFYYDENDKVKYHNQKLLKIRVKTFDYELAQNIEDEINSKFKEEVKAHSAFPGRYYDDHDFVLIDIVSKKAGKENTIKKLLEILKINPNQAITIGDGRNDIEMIKEYNGYSMETAESDVKKEASKIFESIADALQYIKE